MRQSIVVSEGLASINLEPCKCGGKARFRCNDYANKRRMLIECVECGMKSPYTTMNIMAESNRKTWEAMQLGHGKLIARIWNNLQVFGTADPEKFERKMKKKMERGRK